MSSNSETPAATGPDNRPPWWHRLPTGVDMASRVNLSPELMQAMLEHMSRQRSPAPVSFSAAAAESHSPLGMDPESISIPMPADGADLPGAQTFGDPHGHTHGGPVPHAANDHVPAAKLILLLQKNGIFLAVLLLKLLSEHLLGIFLFVGLVGSSWHADSILVQQIALRESKRCGLSAFKYLWVIFFSCLDIACLYYFFEDQKLYRSLYLGLPELSQFDFLALVWVVVLTDCVARLATIAVKAVLSLVPHSALPYKRRGKFYSLLEEMSQFYRMLLPMRPWMAFLFASDGHGWLSAILFIIYVVAKVNSLWTKGTEVYAAIRRAMITVNYGVRARHEDVQATGDSCPICHDAFNEPVLLKCKHVFCEDCVAMWLDRESSCPMCRAVIGDKPMWRDGSTTHVIQLY